MFDFLVIRLFGCRKILQIGDICKINGKEKAVSRYNLLYLFGLFELGANFARTIPGYLTFTTLTRTFMMKRLFLLVVVGFLSMPMIASAGLIGATVDIEWFYPNSSTSFCSSGTAVVGAGLEYAAGCSGFSPVSIDISDTQVFVDTGGSTWSSGSFNGFVMSILSGPDILSVAYNAALSNMGFASVSSTSSSAAFNFAGVSPGGLAVFDIASASVPEPGTVALLALGLTGLRLARKKTNV